MTLRKPFLLMACLLALSILLPPLPSAVHGETGANELLQKSLTLYEIDRELERIALEQQKLTEQISRTEQEFRQAEQKADKARERAGQVLRAYYMGDRDMLWLLLFQVSSFSEALATYEYLQMILSNDQTALRAHTAEQARLKSLKNELAEAMQTLETTKQYYLSQKERAVVLEQEVEEVLARSEEPDTLRQEMEDLNRKWQDEGIPLFRRYFKELAAAMNDLPDMIGSSNDHLIMNGFNYTFQMTDRQLNDFLVQRNDMFKHLTFRFTSTDVIASGTYDDMELTITGSYRLDAKETEKGKKADYLRFTIKELKFNGYVLPDTTVADLEKQVDLGIYPQNLASFLKVTGLKMEEGKMSIMLKLAF